MSELISKAGRRLCGSQQKALTPLLLAAMSLLSGSAWALDHYKSGPALEAINAMPDKAKGQQFVSGTAVAFGISAPIRDYVAPAGDAVKNVKESDERVDNPRVKHTIPGLGAGAGDGLFTDPLVGRSVGRAPNAMPAPSLTFQGLTAAEACACLPPDTNGDVGPNHYVESTNVKVSIYDKTGTRLLVPSFQSAAFFTGLPAGNVCRNSDDGDPIILYDPLADRWLISQFEVDDVPGHQCIAISQTPDPLGAYFAYDFVMPNNKFFDYPHYGVWPDGYYLTVNQFNQAGTAFQGGGIFAFNRVKMLAGDATASYVYHDVFVDDPNAGGMLPSDLDGIVPPPAGLPNRVIEFRSDEAGDPLDAIRTYELVPNYATPASSTFTIRSDVALAAFDARSPNSRNLIEQPAPGVALDAIADRVLFRAAYRNLGTMAAPVNSWVGNFTVNVSGVAPTNAGTYQTGIRWFELRSSDTTSLPTVRDQGTQNTGGGNGATGVNNWMGSVAQDRQGNIALGFSQSSTTQNPNIVIAGRTGPAAAGVLNEGEATFFASAGVQTSTSGRWGDYSSMSVDPADECTFWYAQEYYTATSDRGWSTRIGKFNFPACTPQPKGFISANITICGNGNPLSGATVTVPGGFFRTTNASGNLSSNIGLPPGTYSASVTKTGFTTVTNASLVVADGATTPFTACIVGAPVMNASAGATITAESFAPANNAPDPGETVTVSLPLTNTGGGDPANLVATLQATGGVTSPSAPQSYGVVASGGAAVSRSFTFVANGVCGSNITLTLALADGATNLGTVTYTLRLGTIVVNTAASQNFDSVVAPALPSGWSSAATGSNVAWVTSTTTPNSAPNDAFATEPTTVGTTELVTETINVPAGANQLSFKNLYNMESTFDGMVLEISINGGAFADITAGGNAFVAGGYNATISAGFQSPIGGRQAWSGLSGGTTAAPAYITSTINLPAAASGQPIKLKWISATDSSVAAAGAPGVRIDDIVISQSANVCSSGTVDAVFANGFE